MSKYTADDIQKVADNHRAESRAYTADMLDALARFLRQENAARHLFEVGHAISPFMTLDNGPEGCFLRIHFASRADGQAMHDAMVSFFKEPLP